ATPADRPRGQAEAPRQWRTAPHLSHLVHARAFFLRVRKPRRPAAALSADEARVAGDAEDFGQAHTPMLELDGSAGGPRVFDLDVAAVLRRIPRLQQEHQECVRVTDERMLVPVPVESEVRHAINRAPLRFGLEEISALLVGELPLGLELVV